MASKRITLNDDQQEVLKEMLEFNLNGYYSDSNIEDMNYDSFEEKIEVMATQSILKSILKKLK